MRKKTFVARKWSVEEEEHQSVKNQEAGEEEAQSEEAISAYPSLPGAVMGKSGLNGVDPHRVSNGNILSLQRSLGNRAIGSWLKKNNHPKVMRAGEEEGNKEDKPKIPESGSLPTVEIPPDPTKEIGRGQWHEDRGNGTTARSAGTSTHAAATSTKNQHNPGEIAIGVNKVGMDFSNPESDFDKVPKDSSDTVTSAKATGVSFANPESYNASPFGAASYQPEIKGITFKTEQAPDDFFGKVKSWFSDTKINVDFTLDVKAPWGTDSGGVIDVPSATDGIVTNAKLPNGKKVYEQMVADLHPKLIEKSWRAARSQYWSKAICSRHEMYHTKDMKEWSEGDGKDFIQNYMKDKTVNATKIDEDLKKHFENGIKALRAAFMTWFKGGETSYLSFLGEERAFGDGKQPYMDLAAAIKVHGEALDEADAKKEEEAKKASATPPTETPTTTPSTTPVTTTPEEVTK